MEKVPKIRKMSIGRDSSIMAALTLASKFLGFVRNFMYGLLFGGVVSLGADAFSAANSLPSSIWLMLGSGTLNAILVPAIVRASENKDGGVDYISRIVTLITGAAIALTVLCMAIAPALIRMINGAIPDKTYDLAITFSLLLLPQIIFSALVMVFSQILNAFNIFGSTMWAPAINNIVCIAGISFFLLTVGSTRLWEADDWSLSSIAVIGGISLLGSLAQAVYLYSVLWKNGIRVRFKTGFRGLGLRKLGKIGFWTLVSTVLGQVAVWSVRWAAGSGVQAAEEARIAGGNDQIYAGFASIDYSYTVFIMAQSIFVVSIVTAIFPKIARNVIAEKTCEILEDLRRVSGLINFFMGFCTVILIAFAPVIMWVAIGGTGRTAGTSAGFVLAGYALSLIPISLNYLVRRVFYAKEDAKSVFYMQIPVTALAVLGSAAAFLFAPPDLAAFGGVLSMTIGSVAGMILSLFMLKNVLEDFKVRIFFNEFWKVALASAVTLVLGFGLYFTLSDFMWHGKIQGVVSVTASTFALLAVYCLILHMTKFRAWMEVKGTVSGRVSGFFSRG